VLGRLGLIAVAPGRALALADDPDDAGRAGTDLFLLLVVTLIAVHLRRLVAATWLAAAIEPGLGARVAFGVIGGALTAPLAALLVAAAVIFALGGRRRALGRAFDLACVVVVPLLWVEAAATLVVRAADIALPTAASWGIAAAGYAWTGALVALAVRQARGRGRAAGVAVAGPVRGPRRVGAGVVGLFAALLAVQATWVIRHVDWLRPMTAGDRMPPFALPRIGPGGALGEPVRSEDLAGQVIVLDFWATWCRPCVVALPELSALARRGLGRGLVVLSVALDEPEDAHALFAELKVVSTLVADAGDAAERYGVGPIPHLVVIDRGGRVRLVSRGGSLRRVIELADALAAER
jgi:thiol-disulfide isomerase/thioredoxin